jgi:hypothetical protein
VQVVHEKWTSVPPTPWKSWIGGGSAVGPLHEIVPMPASLSSARSWTSREEVSADFPTPWKSRRRQSRRSSAADHGSAGELDLRSILAGKVGGGRGIEWNRGVVGRREAASGRPAIEYGSAGEALDSTGLS